MRLTKKQIAEIVAYWDVMVSMGKPDPNALGHYLMPVLAHKSKDAEAVLLASKGALDFRLQHPPKNHIALRLGYSNSRQLVRRYGNRR